MVEKGDLNLTMKTGGVRGNETALLPLVIIFKNLKRWQYETDLLIKLYHLPLIVRLSLKCSSWLMANLFLQCVERDPGNSHEM